VWNNSGFNAYPAGRYPKGVANSFTLKELEKPGLLDRRLALEAGRNTPAQTHTPADELPSLATRSSTSDQAVAATEPFFDERPIQGFFNKICAQLSFPRCV